MDPLGDQLTSCPIEMGWETSIESCPNWCLGNIVNPDNHFAIGNVLTAIWIGCDCPELLLPLESIILARAISVILQFMLSTMLW